MCTSFLDNPVGHYLEKFSKVGKRSKLRADRHPCSITPLLWIKDVSLEGAHGPQCNEKTSTFWQSLNINWSTGYSSHRLTGYEISAAPIASFQLLEWLHAVERKTTSVQDVTDFSPGDPGAKCFTCRWHRVLVKKWCRRAHSGRFALSMLANC